MEWNHYERPNFVARQQAKAAKVEREHAQLARAFRDTTQLKDSIAIEKGIKLLIKQKAREKYIADHKQPWNMHTGKPLQGEFSQWTDITTPRVPSIIENLFGETIPVAIKTIYFRTHYAPVRSLFITDMPLNYIVGGVGCAVVYRWNMVWTACPV